MASHYAIFYCLENSIRELIVQRLEEEHGAGWWDVAVPEVVRRNADTNRKKDLRPELRPGPPSCSTIAISGTEMRQNKSYDFW